MMMARRCLRACLLLGIAGLRHGEIFASTDEQFELLYQERWKDGIGPDLTVQAPKNGISVIENGAFGGEVLKALVRRADDFTHVANGTPRAEVSFARAFAFAPGFLYEVRWSTMTPENYAFDSQQPELFSQILQGPSGGIGPPPFSIRFVDERYQVEIRNAANVKPQIFVFGNPAADRGKVIKWTLQYVPDQTGKDSITNLYMNGVQVVRCDHCGNAYAYDQDAYLKLGLYKWWWQSRPSDVFERTLFFGDVQVFRKIANHPMSR